MIFTSYCNSWCVLITCTHILYGSIPYTNTLPYWGAIHESILYCSTYHVMICRGLHILLSKCGTLMSQHSSSSFLHLNTLTNSYEHHQYHFGNDLHHILWHTSLLVTWYIENSCPTILKGLQTWLSCCFHCTMSLIISILFVITIKFLIITINMWSMSFHLTSCKMQVD